jgi:hypothetical protein
VSQPVNAIGFFVKPVIAELVEDKQKNQDAASDSYGQSEDVDEIETFVPAEVSKQDFQIVLEHILFLPHSISDEK